MGSLFGGSKPPPPPPVAPMPDPGSEEVRNAKRRAAAAQVMRSGRDSTIMTQGSGGSSGPNQSQSLG